MARFILKHSQSVKPEKKAINGIVNNKSNNTNNIMSEELTNKLDRIEGIVDDNNGKPVKRIKKDKGLIERTESSKIVLTEDNKQLLID